MFDRARFAARDLGVIERDMHRLLGIGERDFARLAPDRNADVELLSALARKRLLVALAALDFASGKLPQQRSHLALRPLADQDFVVSSDQRGDDFGLSFFHCFSLADAAKQSSDHAELLLDMIILQSPFGSSFARLCPVRQKPEPSKYFSRSSPARR